MKQIENKTLEMKSLKDEKGESLTWSMNDFVSVCCDIPTNDSGSFSIKEMRQRFKLEDTFQEAKDLKHTVIGEDLYSLLCSILDKSAFRIRDRALLEFEDAIRNAENYNPNTKKKK